MLYGYCRVSTTGQSLDAQREALQAAGCERIFEERVSGAKSDRRELARLLAAVEGHGPGAIVVVTRLDRLARSTLDLLSTLDRIANAGAGFRSLADTWADTTTPHGRLMVTVLGGLAAFERELIIARTREGRARARARGVHLGRPAKLTPAQRQHVRQALAEGETQAELARRLAVSPATISRMLASAPA